MTTIVAELGINHNGDPDTALEMIRVAAEVGCDAVKVQSFRAGEFLRQGDPDWDVIESCEIWPYLPDLAEAAHDHCLLFGVTPQVAARVVEAVSSGADYLKVASEAITHHGLIQSCLDTGLPVWVSTGLATFKEIDAIPYPAKPMLCTSLYPCPDTDACLRRFKGPRRYHGFSDHTMGWTAAVVAVAHGVEMIEKHFTLNRAQEGPDHSFSADPDEMFEYVANIRKAEAQMGEYRYPPSPAERDLWLIPEGTLRP